MPLSNRDQYRTARLSRDRRFDGQFFVAVKTTGIFCRPICPANLPKEENVDYYANAASALQDGFRPCKRCHPDSAPTSWRWLGVETTFQRAVSEVENGYLQQHSIQSLADKLGISDRYLRKLFERYLGLAPKQYALYQQLMFAKRLLHSSQLSITDVGYASGFNSTRRFNDAFINTLKLTPSELRKAGTTSHSNRLSIAVRTPYHWRHLLDFYALRAIEGIEKIESTRYSRYCLLESTKAWFSVDFAPLEQGKFFVDIEFKLDDIRQLRTLVQHIRRVFDLDTDVTTVEESLSKIAPELVKHSGVRIPGVWDHWEAGVRAIIGQQVSVKAAIGQLNLLVSTLQNGDIKYFPTPQELMDNDLGFLKMPTSRKETLKRFALFMSQHWHCTPDSWIEIKGVGPWTINYAKIRGLSDPNCFLDSDLVVKKALINYPHLTQQSVSPWGSYATFHCWSHA
ncbi:ADA regulatory protein [Vibrio astriarenae]|nr:ADA regulatory protein [Vibrio sp. C7]